MDNIWFLAALWVGLALVATLVAIWFRVSTALSEIVVGTVAQLVIGVVLGGAGLLGRRSGSPFSPAPGPSCLRFWPAPSSTRASFDSSGRRPRW
jgi:glutathione-regulated potassium-efflux system ancillary protein KefC